MPPPGREAALAAELEEAGFPAGAEEARELWRVAGGDEDALGALARRRLAGEPIAWLLGWTWFAGARVRVEPGVYVPRPQTEALVERAIARLPDGGLALDLGTGSGALAVALRRGRPRARVLGTDVDAAACRCAAANGVEVLQGHLADPVPQALIGAFDVVVAVLPYVPREELAFLPRDVRAHEPVRALDGGPGGGLVVLREATHAAAAVLRPGGAFVAELGGAQDRLLEPDLARSGFVLAERIVDEDGDLRGVVAVLDG